MLRQMIIFGISRKVHVQLRIICSLAILLVFPCVSSCSIFQKKLTNDLQFNHSGYLDVVLGENIEKKTALVQFKVSEDLSDTKLSPGEWKGLIYDNETKSDNRYELEQGEYVGSIEFYDGEFLSPPLVGKTGKIQILFGLEPDGWFHYKPYSGSLCEEKEFNVFACPLIRIEEGQLTKVTLSFQESTRFSFSKSGFFTAAIVLGVELLRYSFYQYGLTGIGGGLFFGPIQLDRRANPPDIQLNQAL